MTARSYGHYDALAQTLDAVGERWALLIVRELLSGPARYVELQRRLPGVGSAQLAHRLRELERDGLISRSNACYELTTEGLALAPALYALVRFGISRLHPLPRGASSFRPTWAALALRALADASPGRSTRHVSQTIVEDEVFHTVAGKNGALTGAGATPKATIIVSTDTMTAFALARRESSVREAAGAGLLSADGLSRDLRVWASVHCLRPE